MNDSRAAIRYAKAILDLALENKATDAIEKDMRTIVQTISESGELRGILSSPILKADSKRKAVSAVFKGHHKISQGLLDLLIDKKRIDILNDVALKYIALSEKLKGEDVAYVTTAVPLNKALEGKILKQLGKITGNKVVIKNTVDERIIGGFVLRIGDSQYDASIKNQLNHIQREFTNSL